MRSLPRLLVAAAAATLFAWPAAAGAQPGAPPPPPPNRGRGGGGYYAPQSGGSSRFHPRFGLTLGASLGFGGMSADSGPICPDCDYNPVAVGFEGHLGAMVNPRLAILGVVAGSAQSGDSAGLTTISQTMLLGAVQYWVLPQLWIEGGLGVSVLKASYDDGYYYGEDDIDQGMGVMGAAGFELYSAPRYAIDLQLRLESASYGAISDHVQAGTLGIGFNWF